MDREEIIRELAEVINKNCLENNSDTPDFILAEYLFDCLVAFDAATHARRKWYNQPTFETRSPFL